MIHELAFASCYTYSPCGRDGTSAHSRRLRAALKTGNAEVLAICVDRVRKEVSPGRALAGFFAPDDVLVPVPSCAPKPVSDSVPAYLARRLVNCGLGREVWCGLERVVAVRKSATSPHGGRPGWSAHFDSLAVLAGPCTPFRRLTLVDDVVTKGRTLLAAAMRLHTAHPLVTIRAFALLRTLGLTDDLERLLEPCIGVIRWRHGDAHRVP